MKPTIQALGFIILAVAVPTIAAGDGFGFFAAFVGGSLLILAGPLAGMMVRAKIRKERK